MFPKNISLQKRVLIYFAVLFIVLGILVTVFFMTIMLGGIAKQEEQYAKEHVVMVENAIQGQFSQLERIAKDWAPWDDTYEFILSHDEEYVINNLHVGTFENLELDMMVFLDQSGEYVFAQGMDWNKEEEIPIYEDLREQLEKSGLLTNTDPARLEHGIIMLVEGPMLFSSHPIVKSDFSGTVRGNLIVGRFINEGLVIQISDELKLQVSAERLDGEHNQEFDRMTNEEPVILNDQKLDSILAFSIIEDIYQQPAMGLIVSIDRDFTRISSTSAQYLGGSLAGLGLLCILIIGLFLDKSVLSRLKRLSDNVMTIGENQSCLLRLPVEPMADEIAIVNNSINKMLDKLETAQNKLKASEDKYRTFVEKGRDVIYSVDQNGMVMYISPNCEEIIRHKDKEITGEPFIDLLHPDYHDSWKTILQQANRTGRDIENYEFLGKAYDGTWQWFSTDISVFVDSNQNNVYRGIFYNINDKKLTEAALLEAHAGLENEVQIRTQQLLEANIDLADEIKQLEKAQNKIERLAYYDHLTGLPNRLLLSDRLDQAIDLARRIEKPIGIIFMDLDGFKTVNDTLGHRQGDKLLKAVAARLVKLFRKSDTVTRISGDEFIIMAPNLETADCIEKVAEKIVAAFQKPFMLNQQEVYVTVSVGISTFPADGQTGDELIKNADIAMYKAKEMGKNQYVLCTTNMKEVVAEKMILSNRLYRALENNELEVYYQPQVRVSTNKIVGLEALLRWNHPEMGMVPPGKFISLAEQTGLIIPIGEWVMRTVCRQSKKWQEEGLAHIRIAVNMSVVQFQSPEIISQIRGILEETNLSPQYLELEITESIAMRDTDYIIKVLTEFQEIGLYVSIDDFGTEYSSLKYLKLLPINRIKIPMPFIQGIDKSQKDEAITKAIIVLAKNMGMDIIAEGVETQQQETFLTQRFCDVMQGYYYYKPMPANEIEAILKNN